jgi:hypothetical protein
VRRFAGRCTFNDFNCHSDKFPFRSLIERKREFPFAGTVSAAGMTTDPRQQRAQAHLIGPDLWFTEQA